jgi:uncharacterized membrane protein
VDLNRLIYRVLWSGVVLSVAVIVLGLAAKALSPAGFPRIPAPLPVVLEEAAQLTPSGLLSLGVLLMILTPIARVFLTTLVFAEERDRTYVLVTGIVFFNLMLGVALGLLGVG